MGATISHRDYAERDSLGLTGDGILDTEKGNLGGGAIQVRWQGLSWPQDIPELLLQGDYQQFAGSTTYRGYLQSGSTLTPYRATTENRLQALHGRIGWAMSQSDSIQWMPFLEYRHQQWTRDLIQYRETFRHDAGIIGLLGQWRAAPAWTLEGEVGAGATFRTRIDVPALGFSEPLPSRGLWTVGASAHYQIYERWRAVASIRHEQSRYGESAVSKGLIEPASRTRQTDALVGIDYQF